MKTPQFTLIGFLTILGISLLTACGGSAGSSESAIIGEASTEVAAASLSAVFSGLGTSSSVSSGRSLFLDSSQEVCNSMSGTPSKMIFMGRGRSGTFGSTEHGVTVADTEFCTDSEDIALSGTAEDGNPRYAFFVINAPITGDCGSSGTINMVKGHGISRNIDGPVTEIHGMFEINETILNCSLRIDSNGELDTSLSSCNDDEDNPVSLASTSSCVMSANIDRMTVPSPVEGHFGVTRDEGQNVAYECFNYHEITEDADGFLEFSDDCTTFDSYDFNLSGFSIGLIVTGDADSWSFDRPNDPTDFDSNIKMMRMASYPVFGSVDMLYVADYDPEDSSSISDSEDFPQALLDNETFQAELRTEIVNIATEMDQLNVEWFAPLAEGDRVFGDAGDASVFLQSIVSSLDEVYDGDLVWIGQHIDTTSSTDYDFTGFDHAAVNLSPDPSMVTSESFETYVDTQLGNLKTLADSNGIPFLITNAGIWGGAIGNAYDWGTQDHALEAFQIMTTTSATLGTNGIIYWEGSSSEVVFEDYPGITSFIQSEFLP